MIEMLPPLSFALIILISSTVFAIAWGLDAMTHKELVKVDITDKELQTHRNILTASLLMEISLVFMYWFPLIMLPVFIATLVTRTVHEFIDELHFHTDRCSSYESTLHLIMWITVITKTAAMFIWGFFTQYNGVLELPLPFYIWGLLVFSIMGYTSWVEYKR
jgi:magnesium-transporting ATPase (P-type)